MTKAYTITEPCNCCKGSGKIMTGEGHPIDCPYCKGTGQRTQQAVHPSHRMTESETRILAPSGTPRFYSVRHCEVCGKEEWEHAAGHFLHGLDSPCVGASDLGD